MSDRQFSDPHVELATRYGLEVGDVYDVHELAAEASNEHAEAMLRDLGEAEAKDKAASIKQELDRMRLLW
jgi:hypothetical protein